LKDQRHSQRNSWSNTTSLLQNTRYLFTTGVTKAFTDYEKALDYIKDLPYKIVIKASGLAAGKGVILPETTQEAETTLKEIMVDRIFGDAGSEIVIEERLEGEEVSVLAFTDGYSFVTLPPAQDHKRLLRGDKGPNTGGMGAYAPAPVLTKLLLEQVSTQVLDRAIKGMRKEGHPYIGVLYAGIMLTKTGPKVLEFNCRFGDPETQVILPLLDDSCDFAEIMLVLLPITSHIN
jgi:phosphoribosylamine--glycine ligase/phosphoribosylformylglycinamidine cyclo-ligase